MEKGLPEGVEVGYNSGETAALERHQKIEGNKNKESADFGRVLDFWV